MPTLFGDTFFHLPTLLLRRATAGEGEYVLKIEFYPPGSHELHRLEGQVLVQGEPGTIVVLPRAGLDMKERRELTEQDLECYALTGSGLYELSGRGIFPEGTSRILMLCNAVPAINAMLRATHGLTSHMRTFDANWVEVHRRLKR